MDVSPDKLRSEPQKTETEDTWKMTFHYDTPEGSWLTVEVEMPKDGKKDLLIRETEVRKDGTEITTEETVPTGTIVEKTKNPDGSTTTTTTTT